MNADPLWRFMLHTGRSGDWALVRAPDEDAARKQLTRAQRAKAGQAQRVYSTREHIERRERKT